MPKLERESNPQPPSFQTNTQLLSQSGQLIKIVNLAKNPVWLNGGVFFEKLLRVQISLQSLKVNYTSWKNQLSYLLNAFKIVQMNRNYKTAFQLMASQPALWNANETS